MRKWLAILGILAATAVPVLAAKRMTIEQVHQTLASAAAAHRSDDSVAAELFDVEVPARISTAELDRLLAAGPGPRTTDALRAIADKSQFLDPPASELPARPAPDVAAQRFMLSQTVQYVTRTLRALPNFSATRQTEHYDDSPRAATPGAWPSRSDRLYHSHFEAPIAFRDGRESDAPSQGSAAELARTAGGKNLRRSATPNVGLTSWGEFGPVLEIVLLDASKGKLGWSHWEQIDGKPAAVFQFSIDRAVSHYNVQYRVEANVPTGPGLPIATAQALLIAGYHGRLTVDPDSGTVFRVVVEADLPADVDVQKADIMVEYGAVKIGENERICPLHSIALSLSKAKFRPQPTSAMQNIVETQLNDVRFSHYRRFGSEATLIMSSDDTSDPVETPAAEATSPQPPAPADPATAGAVPVPAPVAAPVAEPVTTAVAAPSPGVSGESDETVLVRDASDLPGLRDSPGQAAGQSPTSSATGFTLKVTTRLVDMGLVVTDKHGKPITDLKRDEVEIYDNGHKQQMAAFHHFNPGTAEPQPTPPSAPTGTFTNAHTAALSTEDAPDLLILLMDESHLAFNDLNRARGEVLRFLKATRPDSRVAVYSISEHGFHVIQDVTTDHSLAQAKLAAWMPSASAVSQAQALDRRNNQQIDTVRNPSDLNSVNGNNIETPDYITSIDPQLRQMGDNPLRWALGSMIALAHHFATVPGHKTLAWISGDSALANWDDRAVGMEKNANDQGAAINHAKEALNEAHIALYAVDASIQTVGGAAVSPELANANVELNPVSTANSAPAGFTPPRTVGDGRVTAQMQQDLHGIQGPVRDLAESTGGRAINKGSDLKATLDGIEAESTALYEIGFDPDTQADGKFHTLVVKIPGRKDVKLRYRSGYLYDEQPTSMKDRFQQAVWSPQDATGIALTAEAVPPSDSPTGQSTVKLRIALAGLALEATASRWSDNLYIFIAQRNDAIQKAQISGDTLRLSLKPATYESGMPAGIPYQNAFDVASKQGSVRVIVIDGNSGKMGSVTLPSSALRP